MTLDTTDRNLGTIPSREGNLMKLPDEYFRDDLDSCASGHQDDTSVDLNRHMPFGVRRAAQD